MNEIVRVPKLLLPKKFVDMTKWSVVACDQYTSEPEYWQRVKERVGDSPSTFNIIYPEVYLEEEDPDRRIAHIHKNMKEYEKHFLVKQEGFILIKRILRDKKVRQGLLLCIDLEAYDYTPFTKSPIRATEGTVMDRLPPRIRIRHEAPLESPHIMFLIDDKDKTVIEPLFDNIDMTKPLYDFELMEQSGSIKGFLIDKQDMIADIITKINLLENNSLIFAVGDGNHSLATAKEIWNMTKKNLKEADITNHPARFAMVEVVNLYDDSLVFEPIHRVLFDSSEFLSSAVISNERQDRDDMHCVEYIYKQKKGYMYFPKHTHNLPVGALQSSIDDFINKNKDKSVDYIHGEDVVLRLSSNENIGFILPPMQKSELFETVIKDGVLPRKTFSMGEAHDKRFYLECRRILP